MNFGNCAVCGKAISYGSVRICSQCKDKELDKVQKYLRENGVSRIENISKDLNIPKKLLYEFVIENKVEVASIEKADVDNIMDEARRSNLLSMFNSLNQNKTEVNKKIVISDDTKRNKMRFLNKR